MMEYDVIVGFGFDHLSVKTSADGNVGNVAGPLMLALNAGHEAVHYIEAIAKSDGEAGEIFSHPTLSEAIHESASATPSRGFHA